MSEGLIRPETGAGPRSWALVGVALLFALIFFVWCGADRTDLRYVLPWAWSEEGWVIPSRGLALVMMAACLVYAVLSRMAYRLMTDFPAPRAARSWSPSVIIFALAIALRGAIVMQWMPLPLNADALAGKYLPTMIGWRWSMSAVDALTIVMLLIAVQRAGRSAWWVALYAFHPLTLMEIAADGNWTVLALLPLGVLGASGISLPRRLQWIAIATLGIAAVVIVSATTSMVPFNSVASLIPFTADGQKRIALPLMEAILQAIVLVISWRRGWRFERALSHIVLLMLFGMSAVSPVMALGVLVLVPLTWNRAGWIVSLTAFSAYAAVPALHITHRWGVPNVLVMLAWAPVVIVELQELAVEGMACLHRRTAKTGQSSVSTTA